jgi:protein TonB
VSNIGVAGMEGLGGATASDVFGDKGPKVQAAAPKKVSISAGVMTGMLIQKTTPVYPPIAKAARVSGTVVLQATISKTGTIENLRVVSGPAMLQQAAMDAVKSWRYRPYLLNNEPVEVETTVNVIFTLGG